MYIEFFCSTFPIILTANPNLNTVAMALSGYTEERNALWRMTCASLCSQLTDPYLKTMFAFLIGDRESYDDVLVRLELQLRELS